MRRYTETLSDGIPEPESIEYLINASSNLSKNKNVEATTNGFINWMKNNIGTSISSIKDWFISAGSTISSAASKTATAFAAAFANIGTAIASAISSTKAYIVSLFQKVSPVLSTPVAGITLGKLIAIAVVSSAVIFVMYKIYKTIKKRKSDSVSEVAAAKGDLRRIKKSINESIAFFDNMRYILREDASKENDVSESASMRMIEKASGPAREMVNWITKKNVNKGVISATGDFLKRHWGFIITVLVAANAIFVLLNHTSNI